MFRSRIEKLACALSASGSCLESSEISHLSGARSNHLENHIAIVHPFLFERDTFVFSITQSQIHILKTLRRSTL